MGVIVANNGQAQVAMMGAVSFGGNWVYMELAGNRMMMKSILATIRQGRYLSLYQDGRHLGGAHGIPFRAHASGLDSIPDGAHVLLLAEPENYITCRTPVDASEEEIARAVFRAVLDDPDVVLPARMDWAETYYRFALEAEMIKTPGEYGVFGDLPVRMHMMKKDAGWIGLLNSLIVDGVITL